MKFIIAIVSIVISAALAAAALFGVFTPMPSPSHSTHTSIIVHQNANGAHEGTEEGTVLYGIADGINRTGGTYTIVVPSGTPEVLCTNKYIPVLPEITDNRLKGRYDKIGGDAPFNAFHRIDSFVPASSEIDIPKAFTAAVAEGNTEEDANKEYRLIYVGPGIDTANQKLSLTSGLLDSDDYLKKIDEMADLGVLPDLSKYDVTWIGLTQLTADPQMEVPYEYVPKLREFWEYFLTKSGAKSVTFIDAVVPTKANTVLDGYPYVTPVLFKTDKPEDLVFKEVYTVPEPILPFNVNEATFKDEVAAGKILDDIAGRLVKSEQKLVILGTTAYDPAMNLDYHRTLGWARASRVCDELLARGVNSENLLVASAGYEGVEVNVGNKILDFYHYDQDDINGGQIPEIAQANRAVHFIPAEDAKEVLERFGAVGSSTAESEQ